MELDVSKFQLGGEWLKLNLETKKNEKIDLLIKPMSDKESVHIGELASRDLQAFIEEVKKFVVDWNVKVDGKKLPCNDKNKKEFLPYICKINLKGETERVENERIAEKKKAKEEGIEPKKVFKKDVGSAILEFAQNFDNFIKN